jgi:hypothetical protein
VAFAETVTLAPDTVAPAAGAVIDTDGGVVSAAGGGGGGGVPFDTVTVTEVAVVLLPAASRAIAVSVCDPLVAVVEFQVVEYGAVVSAALRLPPSSRNWTLATPTLSVAFAETVTLVPDTVAPAAGAVIDTDGGVVSAGSAPASIEVFMSLVISPAVSTRL